MISGEYWLTGDGSSTFADGDVGDYNHAMYAFGSAVGLDEDQLYRLDKKGIEANANGIDFRAAARAWIEENLDEQYHEMDWTDPALLQAIREADVDLKCVQEYVALWGPDVESRCTDDDVVSALGMAYLIEAGADKDYLEWLLSDLQGDPRDYAIEHMGWIRVQGDNFQMWTFGDGELAEIRGFDGFPETDDDDADLQQSSQEIGIEEASTGKHFSIPLQMIFNERLDAAAIIRLMNDREEFEKYKRATKQYEGEEHEHLALNPIKVGDNFIDVNGVKWFIVFMNNIYHIGRHWPDTDTFEWSLALTERDAISKAKIIQRTGKHVGDTMMNPPKFNAALNPPIRVKPESEYDPKELALGIEVEKEHSSNLQRRSITARQHLEEDSHYYTKLKKAGLNPPPKGSPTDLNLWVLDKFFSDKDEVPNRIDPTDVPHLRRCMSAGLIEAVAGPYGKRGGALRLTEKGKQAIREWSLGKNPEDTRVTESNPTMFAYRVHFFDGWNGKNRSMDTTAPSPAKAISNVRYRIAAERGIPLATMPRDMYSFKRVEQLG